MSRPRPVATSLFMLLIAWGLARAQDPVRVYGDGYASSEKPAVTDDPPATHNDPVNAHDVKAGVTFAGTGAYDLQQGPRDDDKRHWADTDYIRWKVNGATLLAKGQVHDTDPKDATIASSEAWGQESITAVVTVEEGTHGEITAENEIIFSYEYLVSGSSIAEASVQLQGSAYDINGKAHTFTLSDQRSESVARETEEQLGFSETDYGSLTVFISGSPFGLRAGVGGQRATTSSAYGQLRASVNRRLAHADGDSGSTPPVHVTNVVGGQTPFESKFDVFSDGSVILRARAADSGNTPGSALVALKSYRVQNSLIVHKRGWSDPEGPPPPTGPGGPPGSETPPEYVPPGEPDGPTTPGDDPDADAEEPATEGVMLDGLDGITGSCAFERPHGLAGERGTVPGLVKIGLSAPAPRDLVFAAATEPADLLDFGGRDSVEVSAGERWGAIPCHGRAAGTGTLVLTLLDEAGQPTTSRITPAVSTASVLSHPATRIWATVAGKAWRPGRGVAVHGLAGSDAGPLVLGRLGFSGFDTMGTQLGIEVEDPGGVLEPLPADAYIAAGETSTELPILLADSEGVARIQITNGADVVEVTVQSRFQEWRASPLVRVPAGAIAPIPIRLAYTQRTPLAVEATLSGPGIGGVVDDAGQVMLLAGETGWFARFRGDTPGRTAVTLSAPGLAPLVVPVEVVPSTVAMEDGRLVISELEPGAEGTLEIWAPSRVSIDDLEVPVELADAIEVEGLGTPWVVVTITADPDLPGALSLPIVFGGDTGAPFRLGVLDLLHEPSATGVINSHSIEVR